jgi:predicted phage terminase large subunit-like protein
MQTIEVLEIIKNLPKQTEETLNDAFGILVGIEDRRSVNHYVKWIRAEAMKIHTPQMYELIHKTYIYAGAYEFDSYMIAVEWNREPQARFWLPRRKVLEGKHKLATQLQEFIEDDKMLYLGFSMPPGTGKSTLIKFLLAYISGKYPQSANMYVSYGDGMVKMVYDSVNAILTDTFEYDHNVIFPDNGSPTLSSEYKTISYRKKGDFPTIGLISLGGSVTGRTRANKFLITDDLVKNKEEARSPERLNKLFEDYNATLTTRTIGDNVKQIQLGTIWSIHDPISKMKAKYGNDPRYKFIAIPIWDENRESNFEYEHPDRYTKERILNLEDSLDPVDFSCLYMQRGMDKEGLAFPSDQLRYYNGVLPDGEPDNIAFVTDIAWGGGDSLSMPIVYIYGEDVYVHDVIFDNRDKFTTKPRVIAKILQHRCKMGRMEANNGGDEYCDDIGRMLREQNYSINLSHKKAPTTMSKLSRIEQHAPNIRNFYFRSKECREKEYQKFMDEVCSFSFTSKNLHDDAPDSLSMLVDYLFTGIKSVVAQRRPF